MAKICFIDTETSNRNAQTGAIHDFGFILEIDGVETARESIKMRPTPHHEIDDESLEVSHVTREQIQVYALSQGDGAFKFAQIMFRNGVKSDLHLYGWNVKFDEGFIRAWLGPAYYSYFYSNSVDVASLAGDYLKEERGRLENFKQSAVAAYLGIPVDEKNLHDGLYDCSLMHQIYAKIKMARK